MEFQQQQLRKPEKPFEIIATDNTLGYFKDAVRKITDEFSNSCFILIDKGYHSQHQFETQKYIFPPLDNFLDKKPL